MSEANQTERTVLNRITLCLLSMCLLLYIGRQVYLVAYVFGLFPSEYTLSRWANAVSTRISHVGDAQFVMTTSPTATGAQTQPLDRLIQQEEVLLHRIRATLNTHDQTHDQTHAQKHAQKHDVVHTQRVQPLPLGPFYALQLMGTRHPQVAMRFIMQHHLQHKAHCYLSHLSGRPWYIVLYGHYAHPAAAKAAQKKLQGSNSQLSAWLKHIPK